MGTIRNYGKVLLGVATLAAGAGLAQYAQAQKASKLATKQTTMVGKYGTNDWRIVNPADEGSTWTCESSGDFCTSNLKPGATPNPDGSYNDSQVNIPSESQNRHLVDLTTP
ncbi:hypothetical protein [Sphingobacterium paramultivorum]|uniref:hypothetical protein n=1 Tax=Sphingobacterium paramultivorum TaxID=2886510 RepID=UPI00129CFD83|nr:hypothetical protein [Sphingobacterium paramultivorum]